MGDGKRTWEEKDQPRSLLAVPPPLASMVWRKRIWEEKDQPRSLPAAPLPLASMFWRKRRRERLDLGFLKISDDLDEKVRTGLGVRFHVLLCASSSWTGPSTTGKPRIAIPGDESHATTSVLSTGGRTE
jgi:hypothetical protein